MINKLIVMSFCAVLVSLPVRAQLYGTSPFQNGPSGTASAGLQKFDPDTGLTRVDPIDPTIRPDALFIDLPGFTVTGVNSVTIDPTDGTDPAIPALPGDPDDNGDFAYAILKVSGITGRVLGLIDLNTGLAREIGNLGDNFSSLTFRADGQLFGVTGNGATVSETLYSIDKTNGIPTLLTPLGNGADGEVIAYNPQDDLLYHWSGNGTVVFENLPAELPFAPVIDIPITSPTHGEIFGSVWDPCRDLFINSNIGSAFDLWRLNPVAPDPMISGNFGNPPDDMRGLALIGGYDCDVDLNVSITASSLLPSLAGPVSLTVTVMNTESARALAPTVTTTIPTGISGVTTTGCAEDPAGIPTCTLPTLFKNESIAFTIDGTFDEAGFVTATAATASDEIEPVDNTTALGIGFPEIFQNGFED